jgi:tRNASer (uridine44-2'-O)-methyltransferase
VVVEKTSFQDLYLTLKERHKHLDSQKPKITSNKLLDVKRHVWKVSLSPFHYGHFPTKQAFVRTQDVAVAAFLMLLWKDMYEPREIVEGSEATGEIWDKWGRPREGFVDLGCVSVDAWGRLGSIADLRFD